MHRSSAGRLLVIALLFIAAFGIRLYNINEPPLDFHATRQYRSLIIARGYYLENSTSAPDWEKQVARVSQQKQGMLEPPIMELLVSSGYRILGGEYLWLPRLMSSLFWLIGGGFLFLIAKRIAGADAALFGTAFYLFLPFGVVASRSFQPDPLMVMLLTASIFAMLRYHEAPSRSNLAVAAVASASAFAVKPGILFPIAGSFLAPAISRRGFRRVVLHWSSLFLFATMLSPAMLIYLNGIRTGTFLLGEAQKTLMPHLWITEFFWRGWLENIGRTVGFIPLIVGLLGIVAIRKGLPRSLLAGLWVGYSLFGLALNYNFATHDYYQLQLIPIVGLSIGPMVTLVADHLKAVRPQFRWYGAAYGATLLAVLLSIGMAGTKLAGAGSEAKVAAEVEIGKRVGHSIETIFLSSDYGVPLEYNGLLSGSAWPLTSDLEWEHLAGVPVLSAEERFDVQFSKRAPEYFIVEDLHQFAQQPDLELFLSRFPIVSETNEYLIFDLAARQI